FEDVGRRHEIAHTSGRVSLDRLLVSNLRAVWIEPNRTPHPPLTEQVPALVQHDLDPAQSSPVGIGHLPVRFALEQIVFFMRKLVDAAQNFLVVHDSLLLLLLRAGERNRATSPRGRLEAWFARAQLQLNGRELLIYPELEAALKQAHAGDPLSLQLERHPGAGRLVRSGAVQDELPTTWKLMLSPGDVLGRDPHGAGNGPGRRGHVQQRTGVDDGEGVVAAFETDLELVRADPRDPELPEKPPALDVLDEDVRRECCDDDDPDPVPQPGGPRRHDLERVAEDIAEAHPRTRPQKSRCDVERDELRPGDPYHAGQRRSDRAEPRKKLGEQQRLATLPHEQVFRSPHARIRLERDLAEVAEHTISPTAPELVPDEVRHQG